MNLEFVSHAGFLVSAMSKKIIIDPWTSGKAFNDSWALLANNIDVNYDEIDYIFITHEHPDHFHFPTLKGISLENRQRIKILYQKHASKRMLNAFEKLGFAEVIELPLYKWTQVEGIDLYCGSVGSMDSFLAIRSDGKTVLNLNDCVLNTNQYKYIAKQLGNVDYLFTQFSFANWIGNTKDDIGAKEKKIADIRLQAEIFKPDYIVPFASFVYFCNEQNSWMNDWVNSPRDIGSLDVEGINFMYPGDKIDLNNPEFQSAQAIEKYMADFANIKIDKTPEKVEFDKITKAVEERLRIFKKRIKKPVRARIQPFGIYITDLDKAITIDPMNGQWQETEQSNTRFSMCSQVCWYTFNFEWGTGALAISGMFKDNESPAPRPKFFFYQNMLSTSFISWSSLPQMLRTTQFLWRKKWEIFYRYR